MKMKETSLFDSLLEEPQKPSGPVTCLGITFENDAARRAYFTEELRKKLQDPEFRKIEGFPIGSDEDILNLSDPPYYTACPNPWIADFIAEWEAEKPEHPQGSNYHREPFAADVSEGKQDPIYNAHSYHTKVPYKAIMRYILHYTQPGDIVFDGFCGTGMTGVAAQMCGSREMIMSLGYQIMPDGSILQEETDENGKNVWRPFSKIGVRRAVLNDLSPAATFIAYNYNAPIDVYAFEKEAKRILKEVEKECGWMYKTKHSDGRVGSINFTIWSDVFICGECSEEIIFWDAAIDKKEAIVRDEFNCPKCGAKTGKSGAERAWINKFDNSLNETVRQAKQVPVLINYCLSGSSKRYEKIPDQDDFDILKRIETGSYPYWHPVDQIPKGDKTNEPIRLGTTHVHHFYTDRNLKVLSAVYSKINSPQVRFLFTGSIGGATKLNQLHLKNYVFGGGGCNPGPRKGVIYTPSIGLESAVTKLLEERLKTQVRAFKAYPSQRARDTLISLSSASQLNGDSRLESVLDYVFIDPPFGSNLMYSELSHTWESWLKVLTNNQPEAIENRTQGKSVDDYRKIMTDCFSYIFRLLKPGRWMTVEFSNTKAHVWNNIQASINAAGFIVGNVSALDKKQGGLNAIVGNTAVKQDLVISAYKPNGGFEERFQKEAQTEEGVWDFVRTHLKYLPITKQQGALLQFVPERDPRILFDQMVAYYVRKGYPVPISSQEFQIGLSQRFIERDGMFFLPDQVAEYDRKKMTSGELKQMSMFVSDEASAIQWLRQLIKEKPQTFSDINPQFMQQLGGWSKNEAQLDLRELLNQNFLCYDGKGPVPEQIHAYLSTNWKELRNLPKDDPALVTKARDRWYVPDPNKAGDLEKLREKALLKEFEEYKEVKKKLKVFRLEAVRAGFKKAWQERDYAVIVAVADKIPNNVLEEDPKLLMWYDQAVTRMGGE
jgi:hypothetical protein